MILLSIVIIFGTQFIKINAFECGDDSLVKYDKNGLPKHVPWTVLVKFGDTIYCTGLFISSTRIAISGCPYEWLPTKVSLFFNRKVVFQRFGRKFVDLPTTKIDSPVWSRIGEHVILELEKPIKMSKKMAPICVPSTNSDLKIDKKVYIRYDDKYYYAKFMVKRPPWPIVGIITRLKFYEKAKGVCSMTYKHNDKWFLSGLYSTPDGHLQASNVDK